MGIIIKNKERKQTMQVYKTRCGNIVKIESFKRLNNGKKLSKSQERLLGLTKIKINRKETT